MFAFILSHEYSVHPLLLKKYRTASTIKQIYPWNLIKSLSGSIAFCEPLIRNGRTFLTNTVKVNAFVQQYAYVSLLSFIDKTVRTQARHLKKALQLPTAVESWCSPFSKADTAMHAMRRRRGPRWYPSYLSQGTRSNGQSWIIIHLQREPIQRCRAVNLEGSHHSPVKNGRHTPRGYLLLQICQPRMLCC